MGDYIEPGTIVVAVDGSLHGERALHWAVEQASLEARALVVVSSVEPNIGRDYGSSMGLGGFPDPTPQLFEGAQAIANAAADVARRLAPGLDVDSMAVLGDPRKVLVDLSDTAHLVVLGSRGRGTVRSMLLGSVSAAVSNHASCPVVVCRPTSEDHESRGVIVGADGTEESLPVIEFAFQQASLRGLPLTVLHCFWDVVYAAAGYRKGSVDVLTDPDLEELRLVLSESVAGFSEKFPDVPVSLRLAHGLVDETLAPHGRHWDLVVVGRHPMASLGRVVTGSIATSVVERAHATVAVVPEATSGP